MVDLDYKKNALNEKEIEEKLAQFGFNELKKEKAFSTWNKFFSYFKNPLIIILIIAAAISGLTGQYKNSIIILLMVVLSIILNFYQEKKSSKAAEKISKRLATKCLVWREGKKKEILAKFLVPGDIIFLSAGDIIPADGEILEADDFFVNESSLSGESFPKEKSLVLGDKNIFSGTNVVSGFATAVIKLTGANTEFGKISSKLTQKEEANAFEKGIKNFGFLIIKIIIFIVLIIFLINALRQKDLIDSLIFSIAVAVGVTPELLPMIMSVNMAKGSINMSKKGVIVKRLNAIPDFGSMDILCTDKTGTLTKDQITLVKYLNLDGQEQDEVFSLAYINGYFETGIKSVLDEAIMRFKKLSLKDVIKIDEIPYDFIRRRSSIVFEKEQQRFLVSKGAPEEIFKNSTKAILKGKEKDFNSELQSLANKLYDSLSQEGYRVLAIAQKKLNSEERNIYSPKDEEGLTLMGLVAFFDPPKEGAAQTLKEMAHHGVEIKILTGDSPLVAQKVCEDLDLEIKGVINGENFDINKLSEEALLLKAKNNTIFARFSPMQKEKIIQVLKKSGATVGYLGDGINDAPSLKAADVGISVENAVDVAKESADIILMRKSLRELMDGIIEGRKTFGNTMKYLMMGLSSNFGNMFSMIGASLFLPFFPMLPGQILLNNLLYDSSQVAIPLDKVDTSYLKKPKHWDMKFIRRFMYIFGPISSLFDFLTFFLLYKIFSLSGGAFQAGWFIESLATQVLVIYIIRTQKIPFFKSRPSRYLLLSTLGIIILGFVLTLKPLGLFFGFEALPFKIIGALILVVLAYLLAAEITKMFFYKKIHCKN